MQKWEYLVGIFDEISGRLRVDNDHRYLNDWGAEGWELITVNWVTKRAFFKRQVN